ncbi:hypothetical protein CAPTEDRAFT_204662, partial [Capitella teleta]
TPPLSIMTRAISSLPAVFLQMKEADEFVDITLVFGKQRIACHKLNYLYSGNIDITQLNAQDLLAASEMLLLGALKKRVEDFLRSHTDSVNCISIINLARLYDLKTLLADARNYLYEHVKEVVETEEMHLLQEGDLIEVLEANASQEENFLFIQKWMRSSEGRTDRFEDLMQHNTIKEEKAQAQVVITNAKEEDSDLQFMSSLCEIISHKSMPKNVSRMGTKLADRVRPMVVTFDFNFDARTFMSRFDYSKSDDDVPTPIKILPYRTREDQTMYKKKLEMARELNKKAKDESPNISFSLRNNGCISKYIKDADCKKWRWDLEWSDLEDRDNTKPKESMSGNDYGTAQHNTHPLMEDDLKKRWHSAS